MPRPLRAVLGRPTDEVDRLARQRVMQARLPRGVAGLDRRGLTTMLRGAAEPERRDLAPSPPEIWPLLGHYGFGRGASMLDALTKWRAEHGDVVRLHFGPTTAHLISDPELVRQVVQERHKLYHKGTRGNLKLRLVLGLGLLTAEGEHWLRHRRIAQPAFHRRRIESFGERMVRAASSTIDGWRDGQTFDAHASMMRLTLRIVSETMLGTGIEPSVADEVAAAVEVLLEDTNRRINALVDVPVEVPTPRNVRFTQAMRRLDEIVMGLIERRRREGAVADDLLSMLLGARDDETGQSMSDAQVRDEVMTVFLAGHETTANALTWAIYLLSKNPAVRRRLEDEVDAVLGGRTATARDAPALEHTSRVLKESMRLFPPAWLNARTPHDDDTLGGHFIPRSSLVLVSPWVVHRHPAHWDDPEGFDPDRFSPERSEQRHRFAYFPFGGGPRVCIGQGFAMMEAELVLATIAQRFRLDLVPGFPVVPEPLVTLRPKHGLDVVAHRR